MGYITQVSSYFPWKASNILGLFDQQQDLLLNGSQLQVVFLCFVIHAPFKLLQLPLSLLRITESIQVADHRGPGKLRALCSSHCAPGNAHEGPQPH